MFSHYKGFLPSTVASEDPADDIAHDFLPEFRAYKDGRIQRNFGTDRVLPAKDSPIGVSSKDVVIDPETGVSARVFIPSAAIVEPGQKLPLLVYYHGGGLFMGSPFCSTYVNYVASLVAKAKVVAVSVDYRLVPEHPVPVPYEDSWAALKWVVSHSGGSGPEPWLNEFTDFSRVFLAGDSAGANIAHNMAIQAASEGLSGAKLLGICLVHSYFGRPDHEVDQYWMFVCPTTSGSDDVRMNPAADSRLPDLACTRVLVCVAEKDALRERGVWYYETLKSSGWGGTVELVENEGEDHVFHLFNPNSDTALAFLDRVAAFLNQGEDQK